MRRTKVYLACDMSLLSSSSALRKIANLAMSMKKIKAEAPKNGLSGRLTKGAVPGVGISQLQPPKALPPRLNRPSL